MLKKIYGDYFWLSEIDKELVNKYEKKFNSAMNDKSFNIKTCDGWEKCCVKTSFPNNEFIRNKQSIDFDNILSVEIEKEMNKFIEELEKIKCKKIECSFSIDKMWYNIYNYKDFQESHNHSGETASFSYVFILKADSSSDNANFFFINPRNNLLRSNSFEQLIDVDEYKCSYIPDLKKGDLIIFPSHMNHGVSIHRNKEENRITISGNMSFIKNI